MEKRDFKVARWFVWMNYALIPLSLLLAVFMYWALLVAWNTATIEQMVLFAVVGSGFLVGAIYTIKILPRFQDTITVTDEALIHRLADGHSVAISWDEEIVLRNRAFLGRLEVIGGYGERMIKLEHQLDGYHDLVALIQARAGRLRRH
ncbi:MAG TPA: hypothetical protein PLC98_24115 [Anaerolineales bacterium]|nr:hypothetical protein [Anaerolineales bacterium]